MKNTYIAKDGTPHQSQALANAHDAQMRESERLHRGLSPQNQRIHNAIGVLLLVAGVIAGLVWIVHSVTAR